MSETDFNSVPLNQRPQLETLVSSQAVTALHAQLTAAQSRVAELQNTSTIDNAYIDKLEMLLRRVRPYITVDCELATAIDGVLDGK